MGLGEVRGGNCPLSTPLAPPLHMAYTIYFSSHLTTPSSSSHFRSSHVSSIFSGSGALFSLFSRLFPLLLLLYFLSHTGSTWCLHLVLFSFFLSFSSPLFFLLRFSVTIFFFLDFSSKFVWHKNFEGVPNIAWVCSYFFFLRVNK